ncbi:phosphohistidine phosphatase SixA [Vibrio fluvialis]|uniref:phosphohistidine phosphatase SixA n=1 Tax=Vibrio fluvialis TaxID=676 RepID=UPI001303D5FC|nr:phosphohistidine phosphatase SixA [Vibrio fluvialis]MBY7858361.1 phosphohistidine phosphatase SixA [Vibrio fluvialis]MBY7914195.1 phosphohistidine phosphatase SixA [Vibrio fluvialis]MBY8054892.1 phosphohistidine phosphatase SixA [Vibrio fluvialis]MBY8256338.1 phosphohistidine phosphatase SixA [Vibrio fluvialis]MBY8264703.1 phosphohistidine phosphatase SixA [Vibrio fluvialis]
MKIFIMRHGEAHHYAASDAERALTERGRNESVAVARACIEQQDLYHFDKVLVSPYLRAQQTWQEISRYFAARQVQVCEDITPYGSADEVFDYVSALVELEALDTLLLVSHLPLVGYLASEFVADMVPPMFPTSGLMCIEFDPQSRQGKVAWNVHP